MKNFISKHATVTAFNGAQSTFDKPHVAYIEENQELNYQAYVAPEVEQYDYVEIGGIKWATMNVGANSITDTGLYFQWGDTQGYTAAQVGTDKTFNWANYKFNPSGNGSTFTKYNGSDYTVLQSSDDAVSAVWGGNWRMPTTAEFQALGDAVNTALIQVNGVSGIMCTDKTDETKTLFFPATGCAYNGSVTGVGSYGGYWSSSLRSGNVTHAYQLYFNNKVTLWDNSSERYLGYHVRGVLDD